MLRSRKPQVRYFLDDGIVPNHPRWPLVLYRRALIFPSNKFDAAATIDALFASNGWGRSWRDTIYDFVHYHSQSHEVLGVARGNCRIEFGGVKGRMFKLSIGDVAILPAGTGHRLIKASKNFLVVGAYPAEGTYDECTDSRDRIKAKRKIDKVKRPRMDPVYGFQGPLLEKWQSRARRPNN